ncbi:hypothetical protein A5767_07775 [Rhodococcus sp. 852002-51564_SCH6189132-a]|nr:hypothetical protein A5767_07775 [Rhodococcus sp. 852002-51564_SCH6189132-a]
MLPHEPDGPLQCVRTGPRDTGVDEGVEHLPFGLAQSRHDRDGEVGEQVGPVADRHAPGHLAAVAGLGLVGDAHPVGARGLAESSDASVDLGVARAVGYPEGADDEDLFSVDLDVGRSGEPVVGEPAGEPLGGIARVGDVCLLPAARSSESVDV